MEENLKWKPRLKNQSKSRSYSNEINNLANQALNNIKKIDKIKSSGGVIDQDYLEKISIKLNSNKKNTKIEKIENSSYKNKLIILLISFFICFCLGYYLSIPKKYKIIGKIYYNKSPLENAVINIYSKNKIETINSNSDGSFEINNIIGECKITVDSDRVDSAYSDPASTPFRFCVINDIYNLKINTHKTMPQIKKPTWEPGVD